MRKLLQNKQEEKLIKKTGIASASKNYRQQIKAEILSDLEKKLEAL